MHILRPCLLGFAIFLGFAVPVIAIASPASSPFTATAANGTLTLSHGNDRIAINFVTPSTLHVHALPQGHGSPAFVVIDPAATASVLADVNFITRNNVSTLSSGRAALRWDRANDTLQLMNAAGQLLLTQRNVSALMDGRFEMNHADGDPLYGIGGYNFVEDVSAGMLRTGTQKVTAGEQGHAGAPLLWSTAGYAVLMDALDGTFTLSSGHITVTDTSRKDLDYYLIVGTPMQIMGDVTKISGATPLFPKWAMGFTNSQWGIDEKELLQIADSYRARHIPLDNFTLDFDWKNWGNDGGEFRWNTRTFPDGPSGKLRKMLDARGIKLTAIMKPRVHVNTAEGREAAANGYFLKGNMPAKDYFSGKLIREINFANPHARTWFSDHMKPAFQSGIVGWWNDEADNVNVTTQHLDMQRAIYEGQRAFSNQRVWSISRNFFLGAQRYAYGLWSGDIESGFASMAGQRARMLSAINVGAMQWGMDGGGFKRRPSDENYARWIQFGAFTPIFRVHGTRDEKRQPWLYGSIAEKAATAAIRLRYALIPYIYSYEDVRRRSGIGLVRPLVFHWPKDPIVRNNITSWMFGEYLLASPVVKQGVRSKDVYLPAGIWTEWFSGKTYSGGESAHLTIDAARWSDIPLFVREGAIIPTQPVMDYVGQHAVTQITVDMFPAHARTSFHYYDDDGKTYDYEHGAFFRQLLSLQRTSGGVRVQTGAVEGSFAPALKFYLFKVHGGAASAVSDHGNALPRFDNLLALKAATGAGWATGADRFGPVTHIRVAAAEVRTLTLAMAQPR